MPTPHISAPAGAFAESVLLPGDPLRAKHIALTHLDDARQVTGVRNMLGFTGTYQGMPVSVMGTGMGMPSVSIYVTELIREYGVQRLIRVGTCGGVSPNTQLRDTILAIGACTDSGINRARYGGWDFTATADFRLLTAANEAATDQGIATHVGNLHSGDTFYNPTPDGAETMERMGVLAVEMEAAALYGIAAEERRRALVIVTVSDHLITEESTEPAERERSFDNMVVLALEALRRDSAKTT
jgi:purine-nucleoside phosphorylase